MAFLKAKEQRWHRPHMAGLVARALRARLHMHLQARISALLIGDRAWGKRGLRTDSLSPFTLW